MNDYIAKSNNKQNKNHFYRRFNAIQHIFDSLST